MSEFVQLQRAITPTHILGSTGTSNEAGLGYASLNQIKELLGINDVQDAIEALSDKLDAIDEKLDSLSEQGQAERVQINVNLEQITEKLDSLSEHFDKRLDFTTEQNTLLIALAEQGQAERVQINVNLEQITEKLQDLKDSVILVDGSVSTITDLTLGDIDEDQARVNRLRDRFFRAANRLFMTSEILEWSEARLDSLESQLGDRTLQTAANELEARIDNLESN